jgi:hypothetical protein
VGVVIQNYSCRHINATILSTPSRGSWKLTGFYEHPGPTKRKEGWSLLRFLTTMDPVPWVCLGDFNEILHQSEKCGGNEKNRGLMEDFHSTLDFCDLVDLGFRGPKFTWKNGREDGVFVQERLDRVVGNDGWRNFFPKADILVKGVTSSDHLPLIVTLQEEQKVGRNKTTFKHEASWVLDSEYKKIVTLAWEANEVRADSWRGLRSKLERCKKELKVWQKKKRGPENEIKSLCQQVTKLQAVEGP